MDLKKEAILATAKYLGIPLQWQGYQEGFGDITGFDLFNTESGATIDFKGMDGGEVRQKLINSRRQ
jgi:hypothetical protein